MVLRIPLLPRRLTGWLGARLRRLFRRPRLRRPHLRRPHLRRPRRSGAWLGLSAFLASVVGCGSPPPSFERVLSGEIPLAEGDRQAVLDLLAASDPVPEPAALRLATAGEALGRAPAVRIEDGRVTGLALEGVTRTDAVAGLPALRELRLTGTFPAFELADHPSLATLHLLSSRGPGRSRQEGGLRRLRLERLAALTELIVTDGRLGDPAGDSEALDLQDLPALESLRVNGCGLTEIPRVAAASPALTDLSLARNRIRDLSPLALYPDLERLYLSGNGLETLEGFPSLPRLRFLGLAGNPLAGTSPTESAPDWARLLADLPELSRLDLQRTGFLRVPAGLADRQGLRVEIGAELAEAADLETTLGRLRQARDEARGELVTRLGGRRGQIRDQRGDCRWRTSTYRPAEVRCRLVMSSLEGTAAARLGETDLTLPFRGGGEPRVRATLTVGRGAAALYVAEELDLIATVRVITDASKEAAEALREPGDRFAGYRRVVARPGEPVTVSGGVTLLGSRVVLWLEAVDPESGQASPGARAEDLVLTVEPP